jgi:hypothetical protein
MLVSYFCKFSFHYFNDETNLRVGYKVYRYHTEWKNDIELDYIFNEKMLNTSLESLLIVVCTPTYHSFGKVTLCLNSYKEVMKVEGGTLQMASTLTSVNNFMELIQGQVITWRSLALVITTLVLVAIFHKFCSLIMYFWWTPKRLRHIMEKQGWKGPKTFTYWQETCMKS